MAELVSAEEIIGRPRHPRFHFGRAVSAEQTIYVMHSQLCRETGRDLRDCVYSTALDKGVDPRPWPEDTTVVLWIDRGDLKSYPIPDQLDDVCSSCGQPLDSPPCQRNSVTGEGAHTSGPLLAGQGGTDA